MFNQIIGFCRHVPFQFRNRDMDQYDRSQVLEAHAIPKAVRGVSYWNYVYL
jgi:hypothetical protein